MQLHLKCLSLHVKILEMRNAENQAAQEDARGAAEHGTAAIPHSDLTRRPGHSTELPHTELTGLAGQAPYTLNFSFEELNTIGLDEAPPRHSNLSWQVFNREIYSACLPVWKRGFFQACYRQVKK